MVYHNDATEMVDTFCSLLSKVGVVVPHLKKSTIYDIVPKRYIDDEICKILDMQASDLTIRNRKKICGIGDKKVDQSTLHSDALYLTVES